MTARVLLLENTRRGLDGLYRQFEAQQIRLGQLPREVEAFYFAGWADAQAEAAAQAREYEHRLDLAYLAAYSPKERAAEYRRRLDLHFAEQAERFFAEPLEVPAPALLERRAA